MHEQALARLKLWGCVGWVSG